MTDTGVPGARAGLTSQEAADRLQRVGPNALPKAPPVRLWRRLLAQFKSPLIYILGFALFIDLAIWLAEGGHGVPIETLAIGAILVLNAVLGVWQERKAESALAKLATLATPHVLVFRDGSLVRLPSYQVVPGDVIRVEAGDRVPADATVRDAASFSVDESVLTGESLPVEKHAGDESWAGTLVVRGTGHLEVVRTGSASAMGRLATMLDTVVEEGTPLERRLHAFGRRVARWVLLLAVLIAVGGVAIEGFDRMGPVLLFAVALAVAAVPGGLPAGLTVTLTMGVQRMARRKALVRRLAAVEALGSVTVIATDKTGTLTENRLEVRGLESTDVDHALRAMVLANDADLGGAGDPLELALLRYAAAQGLDPAAIRAAAPRHSGRPFDSMWKYQRVTVTEQSGELTSYLKGAPEVVLAACRMDQEARAALVTAIDERAAAGYRLLALACAPGETETDLEWLGFIALWDPPRKEVSAALEDAHAAGIRVIMVTGDHPATAQTVARQLGIISARVVTGVELEGMDRAALREALREVRIFARVAPEHKLRIVEALQADGEIVAMTGDGVNDAPALKRADVGVAMGERGSEVSREVADLVLLDDNFATIVAAIEEGRSIYENVRKFIRFLLSTNLSEVLVVTVGAFGAILMGLRDGAGGLLLPLTAAQLLWINLVTDGGPALALGLDRNPEVMRRPPRNPKEPLLDRDSTRFVVLSGGVKALMALALLYFLPLLLQLSPEATRTSAFIFLALGQLTFAYPARHTDLMPLPNPAVHLAVIGSFLLQVLVVTVPGLMLAFGTVGLPLTAVATIGMATVTTWALVEAINRFVWRRRRLQSG